MARRLAGGWLDTSYRFESRARTADDRVGDNPIADIAGAEAAGINAILVGSENLGVKRYSKSLKQVPQWLVDPQSFPEEGA